MATAKSLGWCPSKLGTALFLTPTTVATPTTSFILLNNFFKAKGPRPQNLQWNEPKSMVKTS